MTFVVSGGKRGYLRKFTDRLFSAFPGITVYEHVDVGEATECVKTHRVNAVFIDGEWDAANGFRMLCSLRQDDESLPIYLFAESDQYEEDALWNGATGYLDQTLEIADLQASIVAVR